MIEGEPNDFFVTMDPNVPDSKLWTDKYHLNHAMIPSFLTNELAEKILQTGKAVNFIRRCCGEANWVLDTNLQVGDWVSHQTDFESLKKWVEKAML